MLGVQVPRGQCLSVWVAAIPAVPWPFSHLGIRVICGVPGNALKAEEGHTLFLVVEPELSGHRRHPSFGPQQTLASPESGVS